MASKPIVISLDLGSDATYTKPFDAISKAIDKMEDRWMRAMGNMSSSKPNPGSPGGSGGSGGSRQGIPPIDTSLYDQFRYVKALNQASGGQYKSQLQSSAQNAFSHYSNLYQQTGNRQFLGMLNQLAPSAMVKPPPVQKSMQDLLMDMLMTSRVGSGGGGLMPLVNRITPIAGRLGIAPPALMAAAAAIAAFAEALKIGTAAAKEFAALRVGSGGNPASASGLIGYNAIFGDSGALANRLQSNLQQGGTAAAYGAGLGINPIGGPFGDMDINKKLLKVLQDIANSRSESEALRKAYMVGMPELAQTYNLSPGTKYSLKGGAYSDPGALAQLNDFAVNIGLATESMKGLISTTVTLSPLFQSLHLALSDFNMGIAFLNNAFKWLKEHIPGMDSGHNKELKDNTEALRDVRKSADGLREVLGGGKRAGAAIPVGVRGVQLGDPTIRRAIDTGAI